MLPTYIAQSNKLDKVTKLEKIQSAKELFQRLAKTDHNLNSVRIKVVRQTGIFI